MKKRLLALILAGLLTASLASCVASGNQDESTGDTETTTTTDDNGSNTNPPDTTDDWKDADKLLYTYSAETAMRAEAKTGATLVESIPAETELHCLRQNKTWSEVEYNGKKGYVLTASVTAIDILAKKFTAVDGGKKTMYVTDENVNIRLYPATDKELSASKIMGTLSWNDEVTVVSENGKWSRVEITDKEGNTNYYFISSGLLSANKQIDFTDKTQWEGYFTECDPELTRYTTGSVYFRKAPFPNAPFHDTLDAGTEVTVIATADMPNDGGNWSKIVVKIKATKPGDADQFVTGYINSKLLADRPVDAPTTLEDLLKVYVGFEALAKPETMYVVDSTSDPTDTVNLRNSPIFPGENEESNIAGGVNEKTAVTVVARGSHEGNSFYVIKHTVSNKEGYFFISASYLTIDQNGQRMVTMDTLKLYPQFTVLGTEKQTTVAWSTGVNCYYKPQNDDDPAKTLAVGTEVTIVAEETGTYATWAVVKTGDGTLYFVAKAALA